MLVLLGSSAATRAQAPPPPPYTPYTLHVYANSVQVAALVLRTTLEPPPLMPRERFDLRLDSGPMFHPTRARIEGDDPISLAILIDASRDPAATLHLLPTALSSLAPDFLHPEDHISIFATDCALVRTALDLPADRDTINHAVSRALAAADLHSGKAKPSCRSSVRLRDSIHSAITALAYLTGRRVLLVISAGNDAKSLTSWRDDEEHAAANAVAVFALRDSFLFQLDGGRYNASFSQPHSRVASNSADPFEDPLATLCLSNGGLLFGASSFQFPQRLQQLVSLLRTRYILDFPRPDESDAGMHGLDLRIPREDFIISVAGVSYPIPDPNLKNDPTTVPSSPSTAILGKRHPVASTH